MANNNMFKKDELGGPVGVMDETREFQGFDDGDRSHLSSEHDKPWNPVEEATVGEIDELIGSLKETEGKMDKYVEMYQHGIREMQSILADFKNSFGEKKEKTYLDLIKAKDYIYRFNLELQKKDTKYKSEFLTKVKLLLSKDGIDQEGVISETNEAVKKYAEEIRTENELRRRKESAAKEMAKKPETESKGLFRGLFR